MTDEITNVDYDEDELEDNDPAEYAAARKELEERCSASNIKCEEHTNFDEDTYLSIALRSGREKRLIYLYDTDDIRRILSVQFERYIFLGDYYAICSYEDGVIEAAIRSVRPIPSNYIYRRLLGQPTIADGEEQDNLVVEMRRDSESSGARILIAPSSDNLAALGSARYRTRRIPTLKIEGVRISQHDQALDLLERIANTVFFQIDLSIDLPLNLIRERRAPFRPSPRREPIELQFPQNEYDEAPMALYWYARSATGMPLLQFLAYYQSIEFYFPIYSQAEARRKVHNILKDPSFRSDRDADLGRILSAIKGSGSFGFGDERSQIRATLQECLDPDALREFLSSDKERKEFFRLSRKV